MQKRFLISLFVFLILHIFICGYSEMEVTEWWSNYQDYYYSIIGREDPELFMNGKDPVAFECNYKPSKDKIGEYYAPYKHLKITANKSGMSFKYNFGNITATSTIGPDNVADAQGVTIGPGAEVSLWFFNLEGYFNSYMSRSRKCPQSLYVCYDYSKIYYLSEHNAGTDLVYGDFGVSGKFQGDQGGCFTLDSLDNNTQNPSGGGSTGNTGSTCGLSSGQAAVANDGNPCASCAISCVHKYVKDAATDQVVFLEIGTKSYDNGKNLRNYFGLAWSVTSYNTAKDKMIWSNEELLNGNNEVSVTDSVGNYYLIEDPAVFKIVNASYPDLEFRRNDWGGLFKYYISTVGNSPTGSFDAGNIVNDPLHVNSGEKTTLPLYIKNINLCATGSGTLKVMQIVGYLIYLVKIVVPLILIILATVEFVKGVINSSEKPNKEVLVGLAKKIVAAVIIFLIPTILNLILGQVEGVVEVSDKSDYVLCSACLFDPFNGCE